jgi:hypothetical protein
MMLLPSVLVLKVDGATQNARRFFSFPDRASNFMRSVLLFRKHDYLTDTNLNSFDGYLSRVIKR